MSDAPDLNELVVRCLDVLEESGPEAVERLYGEHPEHAERLRARMAALQAAGLVGSDAASEAFPEQLGEFRLLERLGSGGMGVVYLAEQTSLGRHVALKLIRPDQLYFTGARERFRREVEAVARLAHPGIVGVHSVGEERGIPFFAMDLVAGVSLDRLLDALREGGPEALQGRDLFAAVERLTGSAEPGRPDDPLFAGDWTRACLWIAREVAQALEHAHQRGVLHRDVKPSNIMLTPAGRVLLLDFGLASSGGPTRLTRTGSQVGSLPYMAPEQVQGEATAIDVRTDVYGLAATLYELLSLRAPYDQTTQLELQRAIVAGAAPRLRQLRPALSRDAEAVVGVALDPERARRYASAADFARDLSCVLEGRPVTARPAGTWVQLVRWARRNPGSAAAVVLTVVLSVGGPAVFGLQQASAARTQRTLTAQVDDQRRVAELHLDQALQAVDTMLARVGSLQLAHMPQVEAVRLDLLARALELYGELAATAQAPRAIVLQRLRVGASLARLALDLEHVEEAARALACAEADLERLRDNDQAGDSGRVEELGRSLLAARARLAYLSGRDEQALTDFEAAATAERSAPAGVDAFALASALHGRSAVLRRLGRMQDAMQSAREAAETIEAADLQDHFDPRLAFVHLSALSEQGNALREMGDLDGSIAVLLRAAELGEAYLRRDPTHTDLRQHLLLVYANLATPMRLRGRNAEGLTQCERGGVHARILTGQFPDDLLALTTSATLMFNRGLLHWESGQRDAALTALDEALASFERMAREQPDNIEGEWRLTATLGNRGGLLQELGRLDESARDLERAVALHRKLGSGRSPDPERQLQYAVALANQALTAMSVDDHALARANLREALPLFWTLPAAWNEMAAHCMDGAAFALELDSLEAAELDRTVEDYCDLALGALEAAAGAGLLERADLRANERWEPLRGRPRFEALLD